MCGNDALLRRFAVQLAAQLPEEPADAAKVLEYCQEILYGFLAVPAAVPAQGERVTLLREVGGSTAASSLRKS